MKSKIFERLSSDVLIVGGGGAGLRAAIEARERGSDVLVVSKSRVGYGNNTYISKGSFAAATGWTDARDNPEVHKQDSLAGGRFLNDRRLVAAVAKDAASQIAFLEKCGVRFFRHDGKIQLRHVPGHSYPRHVRGEHQKGSDFIRPLREYALKIGVRFADRILITRLLNSEGRFVGATGIMSNGKFIIFKSSCTILATGGFAQVFQFNNNAAGITGDGQSLAYEIGVPLKDMEFVQFYPTALGRFGNRLLMYEALVSNAGAVLLNADGENIAFASDRTGSFQIFVMSPDGSNQVQLTFTPGNHLYPAWSPDGRQLAYSSDEQGMYYDIYVMQADGSDAVNVTQSPGTDHAPSWSPDGTMLTFWSDRDREPSGVLGLSYNNRDIRNLNTDIFVMDGMGGAVRNLTFGLEAAAGFEPSWSPRGQSIAFVSYDLDPRYGDMGLLDAAGGGIQWLELGIGTYSPSWSRDGSTLAYADATFGRSQGLGIYVVPASGGEPTQLTAYARYALHPTWSPMSESAGSSVEGTSWGEVKTWFKRGSATPERLVPETR